MVKKPIEHYSQVASWCLALLGGVAVLQLHMLPALLAGLLVFELVHRLAPALQRHFASERARLIALLILTALIVLLVALAVVGTLAFFRSDVGNLAVLLGKMAQILDDARAVLPSWLVQVIPEGTKQTQAMMTDWLREHAAELRTYGKDAALGLVHVLIGMIVGAMLSIRATGPVDGLGPLSVALAERTRLLGDAFRRVVFAQVRISALNTALTAVYLVIVLPLAGVHLPLTKTLIAVTFFAGLIPVLGNLVSNSVIVVVSLAHSLSVAGVSMAFLVVVHKLEYFLNARIVGAQINAAAWELLIAMLFMEALFGLPGLVAAPIFYAWLKSELSARHLL